VRVRVCVCVCVCVCELTVILNVERIRRRVNARRVHKAIETNGLALVRLLLFCRSSSSSSTSSTVLSATAAADPRAFGIALGPAGLRQGRHRVLCVRGTFVSNLNE
jgi:hypothetical protein